MEISKLPLDTLRVTALNLPLNSIFKLCQTNKRFQQSICNYKPFWEALFLRKVIGSDKVDIPADADIEWFKYKLKQWPMVEKLADLIRKDINKPTLPNPTTWEEVGEREGKPFVSATFIEDYNEKWGSLELVDKLYDLICENIRIDLPDMPNLYYLSCGNDGLQVLPKMPELERMYCTDNKLTTIPYFEYLLELYCQNNNITSIASLPNLWKLNCSNNKLTSLPAFPNLDELYCGNNRLERLSEMPKLTVLNCQNNDLTFLPSYPLLVSLTYDANKIKSLPSLPNLETVNGKEVEN